MTDLSSIPKELEAIVPDLAVPVQPLLEGGYEGLEPLLATLAEKVIAPAEGKVKALQERRHARVAAPLHLLGTFMRIIP